MSVGDVFAEESVECVLEADEKVLVWPNSTSWRHNYAQKVLVLSTAEQQVVNRGFQSVPAQPVSSAFGSSRVFVIKVISRQNPRINYSYSKPISVLK